MASAGSWIISPARAATMVARAPGATVPGVRVDPLVMVSGSGGPTVMLQGPVAVAPSGATAWIVKVNVPSWVSVPATIVPKAEHRDGMDRPGRRFPLAIVERVVRAVAGLTDALARQADVGAGMIQLRLRRHPRIRPCAAASASLGPQPANRYQPHTLRPWAHPDADWRYLPDRQLTIATDRSVVPAGPRPSRPCA
jgi:hypothetical protein